MTIELPALPYDAAALEPHISRKTLEFHHGKHHKTYVDTYNKLVDGTPYASRPVEEVIKELAQDQKKGDQKNIAIFNNGAQALNHNLFWKSMRPSGGGKPSGAAAKRIESDLGGYDFFAKSFKETAVGQFGSGWAWLILDGGKLKIIKTGNADTPLAHGKTPLITCDVWEHAYYLDYQNRRPDFVQAFLDHLLNWDQVNEALAEHKADGRKAA